MSLTYPTYFPKNFLPPVVSAQAQEELTLRGLLDNPDDTPPMRQCRGAALTYVTRLVLVFTRQAREAARAGFLPMDRIAYSVKDFHRRAAAHAYHDFDFQRFGWPQGEFDRDTDAEFRTSPGWKEHLVDLAALRVGTSDQAATPARAVAANGRKGTESATVERSTAGKTPSTPKKSHRQRRKISAATKDGRRAMVAHHCKEHERTQADLCRKIKIDTSALQGMIREDISRFSELTLAKLLNGIGVSWDEWYGQT